MDAISDPAPVAQGTLDQSHCDVVVVGAGPIGLETAVALQHDGLAVVVVDQGGVGDTISRTFPPQTRFFSSPERIAIAGRPIGLVTQERVTGEEYLAYLRSVAAEHHIQLQTFQKVIAMRGTAGDFRVTLASRNGSISEIRCAYLVLATGGTHTSRSLSIPGEELPIVSRQLGDPHRFFGRRVLVVGGRNSAAESALRIYRVGAEITLSYRHPVLNDRVKYWIRPEVETLMEEGQIRREMPTAVREISGQGAVLQRLDTDRTHEIQVDDVLLQIGFEQDPAIFQLCGIHLEPDRRAPVVDPQTMQSSTPGLFVVGTARAGTQQHFDVFIESCHRDAVAVAAEIAGRPSPAILPPRIRPEQ
jgi:thioredoxin reductase (NADPH)